MPIHQQITERQTGGYGCDLCGAADPNNVFFLYQTQTPVDRAEHGDVVILRWTEGQYTACAVCGGYIDSGNVLGLVYRINRCNPYIGKRQVEHRIRGLFEHVRLDSKRLAGRFAAVRHGR